MIINGTNIVEAHGFKPLVRTLPKGTHLYTAQAVQGIGARRSGGSTPSTTLQVEGHVRGTSPADARAKADAIVKLCKLGSGKELLLAFEDIAAREWVGLIQEVERKDVEKWGIPLQKLTLSFFLPDPLARDPEDTVLALSSGVATAVELGNARSLPVVTVASPGGTVTVEVLDGDDQVLTSLTWNDPGGGAGSLVIDSLEKTAKRGGTNVVSGLTPASVFPLLDPNEDAVKFRVSGGTGISCTYRKQYWV